MRSKPFWRVAGAWRALLFLLAMPVAGAAQPQTLHGHVPAVVKSLTPAGHFPGTNFLDLDIALPLRNQDALSNLLHQICDPHSPNYRHYLTPAQFTEQFGPTEADYQAVIDFANAHGLHVTATHPNRMLVDVRGTGADVERALHLTIHTYRHPTENRAFFAPDTEPSLDLAVPVLRIGGLDNYWMPRPRYKINRRVAAPAGQAPRVPPSPAAAQAATPNAGSGLGGAYQGGDFRAAYVPNTTLNGSGQVVGLLQFDGYTPADISYYETQAHLPAVTLSNVLVDGFSGSPSGDGGEIEVSLDIEMVVSLATNASRVVVYEAPDTGLSTTWHHLLTQMLTDDVAQQISCSWFLSNAPSDPVADNIWIEMAMQGQSFFNASGDDDAYTGLISFPGDSPYITQVGGTTLTTTGPGGGYVSETVWNWGGGTGSGGGISTQYGIPPFQTNISMAANQGSTSQRNTPDVALTADNIYVRVDGEDYNLGGTSCAAPLWAGFAALVNQQAAAVGIGKIGFINQAVDTIGIGANYPAAFHDITAGNNESSASPSRFSAVAGYDLCTGWGTPNGQALINALANPEPLVISPSAGFSSSGGVGGPFTVTSSTFTLTNSGMTSLNWSLSNTSAWLSASSSSGALAGGGPSAAVTLGLNTTASNLLAGVYNATVWFTNLNDNAGQPRLFTLSVIAPPSVTTQPTNQAVLQGATATFNVAATGGLPLSYQWQFNQTNLTDGGNISGSATTNLVVSSVSSNNVGAYAVVVTNLAGSTVSSNALLSITPSQPVIVVQPRSQTAVAGQTVTFSVAAIGTTPFSWQWSFDATNLLNATNASLMLTNVQLSQAGVYAVTVSNLYNAVASSNATLSILSVPVITGFSPRTGTNGMVVNIQGLNFDPTPANDIVYFGAVQAPVTAASFTNLTVTVPVSATFAPLTVTVNGLTAFSDQPFVPTFPGVGQINTSSLAARLDLSVATPSQIAVADLDGDGKPDVIAASGSTVVIYRNISTNGSLTAGSFAAPVSLPLLSNGPYLAVADLDGDGRQDIVVAYGSATNISIFRNISSPGSLTTNSFATRIDLPGGDTMRDVAVQDLNGDGKPEIVTANQNSPGSISVFQNLSTIGNIAFAPRVDFAAGNGPSGLAIGDLDGDGNPDVAVVNYFSGTVSIFRNMGLGGNITTNSFAPKVDLNVPATPFPIAIGDMDGDGKLDLVVGSAPSAQTISVIRNISTPGSLTTNSFAAPVTFPAAGWVNALALGDIDGDGRIDIVLSSQSGNALSIFKNISTPGSFTSASLAPRVDFPVVNNPYGVTIADLDGDGRPDIVFANEGSSDISIYRNIVPFPVGPSITSQPTNQTVTVGGTAVFSVTAAGSTPLNYQWAFNTTNLLGATNATLALSLATSNQAGSYSVLVTNNYGAVLSSNALLTVIPATGPMITSEPTNLTVDANSNALFSVTATGSPPLAYQWTFNTTNIVGATNPALALLDVQPSQAGLYAVLVTNFGGSTLSSNATLTVLTIPPMITQEPSNQSVFIAGNASFSVTATGTAPLSYQWSFNTTNLLGATNAALSLFNVQLTQAGNYAVLVTNIAGSILSSNAVLTVSPAPPVPVITGFSPQTGPPGTVVNIRGTNFNGTIGNNIVYFGAVQAPVSAASFTNLTVTVPVSATYAPITVNVNGLTAFSDQPFVPTFPGVGQINTSSLAARLDLSIGNPNSIAVADLDGDGKPDVIAANGSTVVIYRNISTNGSLTAGSFAAPVSLPLLSNGPYLAVADLDGDGRQDIVVAYGSATNISIFRNISSPGSLTTNSFATRIDLPGGDTMRDVAVQDLNGDGKPEIVTANQNSPGSISVFQNLSTIGNIAFAPRVDFAAGNGPSGLAIGDLDGDGNPDVAVVNYFSGTVSIFRNMGLGGNITTNSFAPKVDLNVPATPFPIAIGDMDGDGKLDLVVGSAPSAQTISVIRNISTPGSLTTNSFAAPVTFPAAGWVNALALGDIDGDGRIDIVLSSQSGNALSIFKNISTPGSFTSASLAPRVDFPVVNNPYGVTIADLDGDGRPDIVFANEGSSDISIYRNIVPFGVAPSITNQPAGLTVDVGGTAVFSILAGGTTPLGYQWEFDTTNLPGATNASLTLTNVQLTQAGNYAVLVTNNYGVILSSNALLTVVQPPVITQMSGNQTNFVGTAAAFRVAATGTLPLSYQWQVNQTNLTDGGNVSGSATTNLTLAGVQDANAASYSVIITNVGGSITSSPALLVVIDLPPLKTIASGSTLYIFWPVSPSGFVLESTESLSPANWDSVTNPPFQIGNQYLLPVQMSGTNTFYHLRFSSP